MMVVVGVAGEGIVDVVVLLSEIGVVMALALEWPGVACWP